MNTTHAQGGPATPSRSFSELCAETLAKATEVLGSKDDAQRWLEMAALGLDGQRPIDLLQTPAGAELVNDFLTRLEYGVYT